MSEDIKKFVVGEYQYIFSMPTLADTRKVFLAAQENIDIMDLASKYIHVKLKSAPDTEEGKSIDKVFINTGDASRSLAVTTSWLKWVLSVQRAGEEEADEWEKKLGEG